MTQTLRIGTRGSDLALWQARHVAARIEQSNPGLAVEIVVIKTTGDRVTDRPLAAIGGKGLFTKELEEALFEDRVDLAVHSLKDMPVVLPDGLELSCYPGRAWPFDALCGREKLRSVHDLREGARVGTGSLRRQWQLRSLRPDLEVVGLRGNVPTRLARRFDADGAYDAVVLASAGLRRLGLWEDGFAELAPPDVLPAPGQGILAIETRVGDDTTLERIASLDVREARLAAAAERACLSVIEGDCHTPFAAFAAIADGTLTLTARLYDDEGGRLDAHGAADADSEEAARELGLDVGEMLLP